MESSKFIVFSLIAILPLGIIYELLSRAFICLKFSPHEKVG